MRTLWCAHVGSQSSFRGYTHNEREKTVLTISSYSSIQTQQRVIMRTKMKSCCLLSSAQFKSTSSKSVCVVGLMAMMADDPEHPDVFLLTDSEQGERHTHPPTHTSTFVNHDCFYVTGLAKVKQGFSQFQRTKDWGMKDLASHAVCLTRR